MAYGRAAYFCIFCALIWLLEQLLRRKDLPVSTLYGVTIVCHDALRFLRDLLVGRDKYTRIALFQPVLQLLLLSTYFYYVVVYYFISCLKQYLVFDIFFICMHNTGFTYCFPITFLVGLFPQINTFTIYLLEQIDMHFFGGTGW